MAYVHCHNCDWQQDDFWDVSFNPLRFLLNDEETLLDFKHLDDLGCEEGSADGFWTEGKTRREVVAHNCELAAQKIREMVFLTPEQAKGKPCPQCGEYALDID